MADMTSLKSRRNRVASAQDTKLSRIFLFRLLVILFAGLSVLTGWSTFANIRIQEHNIREKVELSAKQLASLASVSRTSFDFTYLGKLIDDLQKDLDILRIAYVDNGVNIIDSKKGITVDEVYKLDVPVMSGAEKVGTILIEYSLERVEDNALKQVALSVVFQLLLMLIISLVVYYFFNRSVGSRISDISGALKKVATGDLTVSLSSSASRDEFDTIANGLDYLMTSLSGSIDKFKATAANVEEATEHLNKTFKDVISGVNRQQLSTDNAMNTMTGAIDSLEQVISATDNLLELSDESTSALGTILDAAQGVVGKMNNLSSDIHSSYDSVVTISKMTKEVGASASRANSSMAAADSAVSTISQSVEKIGGIVKETAELSVNTNKIIADRGIKSVAESIESMKRIEEFVKSLSSIISNLGVRSKDIAKVLDVIKEVTEQTKLLSLNAQILSGQAGEHGKPFSVVAAEMKSLSDKTALSTKEIEGIVASIQEEISNAIKSTQETTAKVKEGATVVAKVNDALISIQDVSRKSTDMFMTIEEVATEQNTSLEKITSAFAEVRKLIHEVNRTTTEEESRMAGLLDGFTATREAMRVTKGASEEQVRSIQVISENLSAANEKTRAIAEAASRQHDMSQDIVKTMKRIIQIGAETVTNVKDVSSRIAHMNGEVGSLHKEMDEFKTRK